MKGIKLDINSSFLATVLRIVLILLLFYDLYHLYNLIIVAKNPWIVGEWMINYYDGGFKRRGLWGSIFILIYDLSGLSLLWQNFIFCSVLYILLFTYLYRLTLLKSNYISMLFLVLCPLGLQMPFVFGGVVGRKEILLFVGLIYIYYLTKTNKITTVKFSAILLILVLSHEMTLFFLPFFYLILQLEGKLRTAYFVVLVPMFLVSVLFWKIGLDVNCGRAYEVLSTRGLILPRKGIFDFNIQEDIFEIVKENIYNWMLYIVSIFLGIFTIWIFLQNNIYERKKTFVYFFIFAFIYSLPIFYLAIDWGRWINIHFTLITIILLIYNQKETGKLNWILLTLIPSHLIWGMNHAYLGFHIATKLSLEIIALKHALF